MVIKKGKTHRRRRSETPSSGTGPKRSLPRFVRILLFIECIAARVHIVRRRIEPEFPPDDGEEDTCLIAIEGFDTG